MDTSHASPTPLTSEPLRFVFGGVAFDVAPAPGLSFARLPMHEEYCAPFSASPVALSVLVAVAAAPGAGDASGRDVRAAWEGDTAQVVTRGAQAEVRELVPRHFAASARVSPDASGCSSLLTALAGALVDRVGGVVLHATGVELDGGVVLFVGPSGAGKTTAANHAAGALAFARDRAAIYASSGGWYAAPMSGGDEIELPASPRRVAPLRAILRVHKDRAPRLERATPTQALSILRESAQMTDRSVAGELALLDRLVATSREVPVGIARTVLGRPLLDDVRGWLGGAS